jgi:hypothetical protein
MEMRPAGALDTFFRKKIVHAFSDNFPSRATLGGRL